MSDKEIIQELIRALMFFGVINGWSIKKLLNEYSRLGISEKLVNETLNIGDE